jgi:hypothetical protein
MREALVDIGSILGSYLLAGHLSYEKEMDKDTFGSFVIIYKRWDIGYYADEKKRLGYAIAKGM